MNDFDEAERLRERIRELEDEARKKAAPLVPGANVRIGKTTTITTYPTTATAVYAMTDTAPFSTETEGGAGSLTPTAGNPIFYAQNLGRSVPPVGTYLLCTKIKHRWLFRYD